MSNDNAGGFTSDTRPRHLIVAGGAVIGVLAGVAAWPRSALYFLKKSFPSFVWEVSANNHAVALTFDDGPDPIFTPQVLEILATHNTKATFFLIGQKAEKYPQIVEGIRKAGHEIGNHTDSSARTVSLADRDFETDLLRAELTLGLAESRKFFRPASGWMTRRQIEIAQNHGYTCVLGSAYAFDPYRPPAPFIAWLIKRTLTSGGIIVLHDSGGNRSNTIRALPRIIEDIRARGLETKVLSELIDNDRSREEVQ